MNKYKVIRGTSVEIEEELNNLSNSFTVTIKGVSSTFNLTNVIVTLTI